MSEPQSKKKWLDTSIYTFSLASICQKKKKVFFSSCFCRVGNGRSLVEREFVMSLSDSSFDV